MPPLFLTTMPIVVLGQSVFFDLSEFDAMQGAGCTELVLEGVGDTAHHL